MPDKPDSKDTDSDSVHPFGGHIEWNESFYFNVYDRDKDICMFMRIGLKPNRWEKNMFCYIMTPDGATIGLKETHPYDDPELKIGGLRFQRLTPDKEWQIDFSGPMKRTLGSAVEKRDVAFSLKFEAVNEVYDYANSKTDEKDLFSLISAAEHLEQFGRLSGELTLDGKKIPISGLGERDHAWGVSDWIAPTVWVWLSCQDSESFAFNVTKLIVDQRAVDAGYVHIDGKNEPIVRIESVTEYAPGGGPKNLKVWLTNRDGKIYEVHGEVMRTAKFPYPSGLDRNIPIMYETLTRFKWENKIGYGIAEYLIRIV